jgi:GT2 family glycosyltransferase
LPDQREYCHAFPKTVKVSIIIATHARPESLARLLKSLKPQLRDNCELIVAENGTPALSKLPNSEIVKLHLHDRRAGKCRIQNLAISKATGDVLVFLDDDLFVAADYLDQLKRFFVFHPEFAAMKGRVLPQEDPRKVVGQNWVYLDLPIVDHGNEIVEVKGVLGANMAFRAPALRAVGPFDERLGPGAAGHEEETEMSARIRRAGYRIGYSPNAVAYHEVDRTRADRARFIRIARERGRCRMLHEPHTKFDIAVKNIVASARVALASMMRASAERIAREERRLAVARGMRDALTAIPLAASEEVMERAESLK